MGLRKDFETDNGQYSTMYGTIDSGKGGVQLPSLILTVIEDNPEAVELPVSTSELAVDVVEVSEDSPELAPTEVVRAVKKVVRAQPTKPRSLSLAHETPIQERTPLVQPKTQLTQVVKSNAEDESAEGAPSTPQHIQDHEREMSILAFTTLVNHGDNGQAIAPEMMQWLADNPEEFRSALTKANVQLLNFVRTPEQKLAIAERLTTLQAELKGA